MAQAATPMDLVGSAMTVTLTNGVVLTGTVFTFVPERELLVLAVNAASDSPSFKMVRVPFIQSFTVETDLKNIPSDQKLPRAIDAYRQLPPVSKALKDFQSAKKRLIAEEKKRQELLEKLGDSTPVAAADLFLEISRVFPQTQWDADEQTLTMEDVVVVGTPDWLHPTVQVITGCEASNNKERMENLIKKFSSAE